MKLVAADVYLHLSPSTVRHADGVQCAADCKTILFLTLPECTFNTVAQLW